MRRSLKQSAALGLCLATLALWASSAASAATWRRVGGTGISAGLAGPAGDAVEDAWFSADGQRLYVPLRAAGVWASSDTGLTWARAERPGDDLRASLEATKQPGSASVSVRNPYRASVHYMLGEHLLRSDDGGRAWTNLTRTAGGSVIGRWQSALAISPANAELIVVGNSRGLWKSHDAGVSWASLNHRLPNFPSVRFLDGRSGGAPRLASHLGTLELYRAGGPPGWIASAKDHDDGQGPRLPDGYAATRRLWHAGRAISPDLTGCGSGPDCASHSVSAAAIAGRHLWAGTTNGLIWLSNDSGETWDLKWSSPARSAVTSLWAASDGPAAATIAGGRVLRLSGRGSQWLDISADLPAGEWSAVVGHPETGMVYVAGSPGVFATSTDLSMPLPPAPWSDITADLPPGSVSDLAVDPLRGRLFVALAGHGIHQAYAPAVNSALVALSAADLSERPAAPGSLLTILGVEARSARAGGQAAPILHIDRGRTQLQLPFTVEGRTVRLRLNSAGASQEMDLRLREVSPAIFVVGGDPLVMDARNGSMVGWARPAAPGASILALMAGLGVVEPPWPAGLESPQANPPEPVAQLAAKVGGLPARVVSAQLAPGYIGTYLVEVRIPDTAPPGETSLVISAEGLPSNQVRLVIGR